jgi:DNA-binding CsgD family transcriptional regulator
MAGSTDPSKLFFTEPLTRREREILRLLAQDSSARDLAAQLALAVSLVKWHVQYRYGKRAVNSKCEAPCRARSHGLCGATGSRNRRSSAPTVLSASGPGQPPRIHRPCDDGEQPLHRTDSLYEHAHHAE